MVQAAAAARVVPQGVVSLNELALVPFRVIPPVVMVKVEVPEFLSVTTWAALVEPTVVLANVKVAGVSVAVGGAAAPVPVNVTFCGEPAALSAMLRVPVSVPVAVGLKLTEMVQVAAAARVVPHVVVSLNELALAPLRVIPPVVTVKADVPVFFSVTTWAALVEPTVVLAKVSVAGVRVAVGGAAAPVPVKGTFCGEPVALSATFRVAVNVPVAFGLKVTEIVQELPAANVDVQVVEALNEVELVPENVMPPLEIARAAEPVFLSVTTWAALLAPSEVLAKVSVAGVRDTAGAVLTGDQLLTRLFALTLPRPVARS